MKETPPDFNPRKEKGKIILELLFFSFAFHLIFFSSKGTQSMSTTVVHTIHGYYALVMIYIAFMLSAVLITPRMINKITPKISLIIGSIGYTLFSFAYFLPSWFTLITAGLLAGISATLMWNAKGNYLTTLSLRYSLCCEIEQQQQQQQSQLQTTFLISSATLLNGIFFLIYQLAAVFGNLASSVCIFITMGNQGFNIGSTDSGFLTPGHLASGPDLYLYIVYGFVSIIGVIAFALLPKQAQSNLLFQQQEEEEEENQMENFSLETVVEDSTEIETTSPVAISETSPLKQTRKEQQQQQQQQSYGSVLLAQQDPNSSPPIPIPLAMPSWRTEGKWRNLRNLTVWKRVSGMALLLKKPEMLLLVPFLLFTGAQQGFLLGDFTRNIIYSTVGIEMIGFIMSVYSATNAFISWILGKITERIGTRPLFVLGFLSYGSFFVFWILFHRIEPISMFVYNRPLIPLFSFAIILAIGDASVANVFCNSVLVSLFQAVDSTEAAFSNLKFWQALGSAIMLSVSPFIANLETKLGILIASLIVGTFGVLFLDLCVHSLSRIPPQSQKTEGVFKESASEQEQN